jgi:hypothetical protein
MVKSIPADDVSDPVPANHLEHYSRFFTPPLPHAIYSKKYPLGKFGYFFARNKCQITNPRIFVINCCSTRR